MMEFVPRFVAVRLPYTAHFSCGVFEDCGCISTFLVMQLLILFFKSEAPLVSLPSGKRLLRLLLFLKSGASCSLEVLIGDKEEGPRAKQIRPDPMQVSCMDLQVVQRTCLQLKSERPPCGSRRGRTFDL